MNAFFHLTPQAWLLLGACLLTIVARATMMLLVLQILRQRGDLSPWHVVPRALLALIGSVCLSQLAAFLNLRIQWAWLEPAVLFASSLVDVAVAVVFYRFRAAMLAIPNREQLEEKVCSLSHALAVEKTVERISLNAWVTSVAGVVTHASDRAGEIFRCPAAQLLGRRIVDLVAPDSQVEVARTLGMPESPVYEFQIVAADGALVWVEGRAASIATPAGLVERHATFRDMTIYHRSMQILRESYLAYKTQLEIREKEEQLIKNAGRI